MPRSFLKPEGNLLVLLEEEYGDPLGITLDSVSITKICGHVSESHLTPVAQSQTLSGLNYKKDHGRRPGVQLHCPSKKNISRILFASFGTPSGDCENYATGNCHLSNSTAIVEKVSFLCFLSHIPTIFYYNYHNCVFFFFGRLVWERRNVPSASRITVLMVSHVRASLKLR